MTDLQLDLKVVHGLRLGYLCKEFKKLFVKATNIITGDVHKGRLREGEEFHADIHYMVPWHIEMEYKGKKVVELNVSYQGAVVGFKFATTALGDTLAWVPVIEEWVSLNNPGRVYIQTSWNRIFDKSQYDSRIVWIDDVEDFKYIPDIRIYQVVGISKLHDKMSNSKTNHATPTNWKLTNMIDTQNYAFYVPLEERKPKLQPLQTNLPVQGKFVTLCPNASQRIKHWLNPKGWMELIDHLNQLGYKVVVVGNVPNIFPNTINGVGPDIFQAMAFIQNADFHIGLSSGLSWMAWAYSKPTLMIGSFTDPGYEFSDKVVRVYHEDEQAGLFNNPSIPWTPTWEYDPFNDNVKLSRQISGEHAIKGLELLLAKGYGKVINQHGETREIERLRPMKQPNVNPGKV